MAWWTPFRWIGERLIAWSRATPYWHLHHADGALYMERFWLFRSRFFCLRIHHLVTEDLDRHFHDHPWTFFSLVLRGSYSEWRPIARDPCFDGEQEAHEIVIREPGSLAMRRCTDRHRIDFVSWDCWTLVLTLPARHWWGFYTPRGKVHWRDYESVHNCTAIGERT